MLQRTMRQTITRACRTFPAVLVTGARQSGKTTLLEMGWGETHRFVSLENPDVRQRAQGDSNGFLRDHPPPVILDEIQYAPELLPYIKSAIDENRTPGQWLLTGSQNFPVMQGVSQSLAGRVAVMRLLPFSVGEASGTAGGELSIDDVLTRALEGSGERPPFDLGDWIVRGAYPEVRANPDVDRNLWCASYIQTYLERDVRQVLKVGDLNAFDRFLRLVAARTGQVLNYSEIARDTGISAPTAKHWISILEASGQVFLLQPYFNNFGKRLIKSPKIYFLDTALAAFLMGLHTAPPILQGPSVGAFVETVVVSGWVKAFHHRGELPPLSYWRSRDGLEIDLLIDRNGCLYPVEVKATATVVPHHASAISRWRQISGNTETRALVVANLNEPASLIPGVRAVPWWVV